jgi:ABC-type multidrug transport system ATPase subunit
MTSWPAAADARQQAMIRAKQLTKAYRAANAPNYFTSTVQPGPVPRFMEPNGAGKSATTRLTLGLHRRTAGAVTFNGHPAPASPGRWTRSGRCRAAPAPPETLSWRRAVPSPSEGPAGLAGTDGRADEQMSR